MKENLIKRIQTECTEFLSTANDLPLIKVRKINESNFKKVKVRTKTTADHFVGAFNEAFHDTYRNIHGRSIFCNGKHAKATEDEFEEIYVFPINGFEYLFNPNIEFHEEYKKIYAKLNNSMEESDAERLLIDMIEYSYLNIDTNFYEALFSQKEVIIYNIPYYYAVKRSKFLIYDDLLRVLKNYT